MRWTELKKSDLETMDKRKRTALVNCVSGIRTAFLGISSGTFGCNASPLSNVTHVGADPALMSVLFRPDNGHRHTLSNYLSTGKLTLSAVPSTAALAVHESSANWDETVFEWEALKQKSIHLVGWEHPIPAVALWSVELQLVEHFTLTNECIYTVGQIEKIAFAAGHQPNSMGKFSAGGLLLAHGLNIYYTAKDPQFFPYPSKKSLTAER